MKVSLFRELERIFVAKKGNLSTSISLGQIVIDGYTVKATDDLRWTKAQLAGRLAKFNGRQGRLFESQRRVTE